MVLKFFKTHGQWLSGKPQYEAVENSEAYARMRIETWLDRGNYSVEQHRVETITFKIWRAGDEEYLGNI